MLDNNEKQPCAPVHGDEAVHPAGAQQPAGGGASPLRILVVDDNTASAQTLAWMLELIGHEARSVHDGAGAIEAGRAFLPHVVLMDLGLPGMSGHEVCRSMRKLPGLEHTIFAAQTGWDSAQQRQMSREAGFEYHLVKPVDIETLRELLAFAGKIQALLAMPGGV